MARNRPKKLVAMRLDPELAEWTLQGGGRTSLVEGLLRAYRERRIVVAAEPAPTESCLGDDPSRPVFVCLNKKEV